MLGRSTISMGGIYGSGGTAWKNFLATVNQRYGDMSRESIQKMLEGEHERYMSLAATAAALARKMDPMIRDEFIKKADNLKSDLYTYIGFVKNSDDPDVFTENQMKNRFLDMNEMMTKIQNLNQNIQKVSGGLSLIDRNAEDFVQQAKDAITSDELELIREKAGDDKRYFDALYQNLYAKKLKQQYSAYLPYEVIKELDSIQKENDELIEQVKPKGILEKGALSKVIDIYEKKGAPAFNPFGWIPTWLKWTLGIGGGLAGLYYLSNITGVIESVSKEKTKRKALR